jgi:hypothetical protein
VGLVVVVVGKVKAAAAAAVVVRVLAVHQMGYKDQCRRAPAGFASVLLSPRRLPSEAAAAAAAVVVAAVAPLPLPQ